MKSLNREAQQSTMWGAGAEWRLTVLGSTETPACRRQGQRNPQTGELQDIKYLVAESWCSCSNQEGFCLHLLSRAVGSFPAEADVGGSRAAVSLESGFLQRALQRAAAPSAQELKPLSKTRLSHQHVSPVRMPLSNISAFACWLLGRIKS